MSTHLESLCKVNLVVRVDSDEIERLAAARCDASVSCELLQDRRENLARPTPTGVRSS